MTIIILEGCDATGKSTLAQELHEKTGFEIIKGSSFELAEQGKDAMFLHMMNLLDKKNIIIDRMFISNFVYGYLFDYPKMDNSQFNELASKAEEKATLTVYVSASKATIRQRLTTRGDDRIGTNDIDAILSKYDEAFNYDLLSQRLVLNINTTYVDVKKSASTIIEFAKLEERKIFMTPNH